jgi:hypothetical protein
MQRIFSPDAALLLGFRCCPVVIIFPDASLEFESIAGNQNNDGCPTIAPPNLFDWLVLCGHLFSGFDSAVDLLSDWQWTSVMILSPVR